VPAGLEAVKGPVAPQLVGGERKDRRADDPAQHYHRVVLGGDIDIHPTVIGGAEETQTLDVVEVQVAEQEGTGEGLTTEER
jgi:hypothetical protein